jgi:hypothetical protein
MGNDASEGKVPEIRHSSRSRQVFRRRVASLAMCLGVCALASCAASGPWKPATQGPRIRVLVSLGCPSTLDGYLGVGNSGSDLADSLLPANPVSGEICRHGPAYGPGPAPSRERLYRHAVLGPAAARTLASVIDDINTAPPQGTVSCPSDSGSHTIIAFGYASRADVDLWYADSGCRMLDNGRIGAFEGGNPSFYGAFEPRLEELCPQQP